MRVRYANTTVALTRTATSTYDVTTFSGRHLGYVRRTADGGWQAVYREDARTTVLDGHATRMAAVYRLIDARAVSA